MRVFTEVLLAAVLSAGAIFPASAAEEVPIRILLEWLPQAQFAGYYVAEADGLYREAGLNVILNHVVVSKNSFDELESGRCDYVNDWLAAALLGAAAGQDLVSVAQIQQGTALAIVARRSAGINRLEDLNNRPLLMWIAPTSRTPLCRMLESRHVRPSTLLPMLSEPVLFLRSAVDAMSCMMYSEYYQLIMSGFEPHELTVFRVSDVFPQIVDDGLFTLRRTFDRDPTVARRLRVATMEGWHRAFTNPNRTLALIERRMNQAGLPFPRARQQAMLEELSPLIHRPENHGALRRSSFDAMCTVLNIPAGAIDFAHFAPQAEEMK